LTGFFLRNEFKEYINKSNNLGTGGKLANEYADFLYTLSRTKEKSIAPWKLKKTISMFVNQFSGHQQHDSHEFLMFLISGLHEDLNQVTKKPYYSDDVKETDLMLMSAEYWKRFLSRNKSFIADLIYGQYKSTLTCPKCREVSHTFDPFNCLSLPIPQQRSRRVVVKYIPKDSTPASIFTFNISESGLVQDLIDKVLFFIKEKPNLLLCLEMNSRTCEEIDPSTPVQRLGTGHLFFYECEEEFQRYVVVKFRSEYQNSFECFPRIVKLSDFSTYKELHSLIFGTFASFAVGEDKVDYYEIYRQQGYRIVFEATAEHPCFVCRARRCRGCDIDDEDTRISGYFKGKSFFTVFFFLQKSSNKFHFDLNPLKASVNIKPIELTQRRDISIYDCFSKFREPETLDRHNEWFCPKCKNHVQAEKRMEIYKLPKILIIHLKRFKISGFSREKLNVPVTFPLTNLDLTQFTADNLSLNRFELFAISHHFGALAGGHYTASVKKDEKWFDCNDHEISESKDEPNFSSSYVLFYRQSN
jgi:ubiquitin carboxyl-terminal hydrolase 4/11/15